MMFFDRHRRVRNLLSAYVDGELGGRDLTQFESHLQACDACSLELEQLRLTIDALSSLPEQEPRRSFQLTPEMATAPRESEGASRTAGVAGGLRMAAAGIAAALIVVFVVDLSDSTTNGGDDSDSRHVPAAQFGGSSESAEDFADDDAVGTPNADDADGTGVGGGGGAAGDDSIVAPEPTMLRVESDELDGETTSVTDGDAPAAGDLDSVDGSEPAEGAVDSGDGSAEEPSAEERTTAPGDGGIDTLTAIEIGLAVALAVTVAGAVLLSVASRRSRGI